MRTSRKTDFRKLKITLVSITYHNQHPQCPSLSPHVLLVLPTSAVLADTGTAYSYFKRGVAICDSKWMAEKTFSN